MDRITTLSIRVPKDVQKLLEQKLPNYNNATRWRLVWDTSAIKLDNWLAKPAFNKTKKMNRYLK